MFIFLFLLFSSVSIQKKHSPNDMQTIQLKKFAHNCIFSTIHPQHHTVQGVPRAVTVIDICNRLPFENKSTNSQLTEQCWEWDINTWIRLFVSKISVMGKQSPSYHQDNLLLVQCQSDYKNLAIRCPTIQSSQHCPNFAFMQTDLIAYLRVMSIQIFSFTRLMITHYTFIYGLLNPDIMCI